MKPKITFECKNERCERQAKELEFHYSSFFGIMKEECGEDYWTARLKHCRTFYKTGVVMKIGQGSRTFLDIEAFEEYVLGIAKEAKLLKKLVDRGATEPDEKEQFEESMELLQDSKCPCCGQPLIETVAAEARAGTLNT